LNEHIKKEKADKVMRRKGGKGFEGDEKVMDNDDMMKEKIQY